MVRTVWPTAIQNRAQAVFDADDGIFSADHMDLVPVNIDGERAVFCGECGKIAPTNPDNDLCAPCERATPRKDEQ
jgi:hypothetical protein